jgi:hypothetical protein
VNTSSAPTTIERLKIIDRRIDTSMRFYSGWGKTARFLYHTLNIAAVLAAAAVPVIALLPALIGGGLEVQKAPWVLAWAGIFGALATLFRSVDAFLHTRDTWIRTASINESLRSERYLYEATAGPYAEPELDELSRTTLYAERVNSILADETFRWTATVQSTAAGSPGSS